MPNGRVTVEVLLVAPLPHFVVYCGMSLLLLMRPPAICSVHTLLVSSLGLLSKALQFVHLTLMRACGIRAST